MPTKENRYSKGHYPLADFARGFSIFGIVIMHLIIYYFWKLPADIRKYSLLAGSGVHIFFFCSGFGLSMSWLNKTESLLTYTKKRLVRVYIPYAIVIIISYFLPLVNGGNDRGGAVFAHLFLYKMFLSTYNTTFGPHLWFISTIFQFYIIFPALFALMKLIGKKKLVISCLLISITWWFICYYLKLEDRVFSSCFLQYLWEFVLGMFIASELKDGKNYSFPIYSLIVFAITGLTLQYYMAECNLKYFNDIPAILGFGSIVILLYRLKPVRLYFLWISDFSYELYLLHIPVTSSVYYLVKDRPLYMQLILGWSGFFLTIPLAILFHRLYYFIVKKIGRR